MKIRIFSMLLMLLALGSVAVSCGNDNGGDEPDIPNSGGSLPGYEKMRSGDIKVFTVKGVSFRMVYVEAGTFTMGATSEQIDPVSDQKPVHKVTLTKDYYIGQCEVTQELWKAVTGYSPTASGPSWYSQYGVNDDYPAYYISYADVIEFIRKLNNLTGLSFRMPTEAEWEYAARGGNLSEGFRYSGSNNAREVAWYKDNSDDKIHFVRTKYFNELGIYDMSGNVWEWCSDWYGSYRNFAVSDPVGPESGTERVLRGGCVLNPQFGCQVAYRNSRPTSARHSGIGCRLALTQSRK